METLTREELFTLLARFWALAVTAEGASGPGDALGLIADEARDALSSADVSFTYPDWLDGSNAPDGPVPPACAPDERKGK